MQDKDQEFWESRYKGLEKTKVPFLYREVEFLKQTNEKVPNTRIQHFFVAPDGELKPTLAGAMSILQIDRNILYITFNFRGLTFNIFKGDSFDDVYSMIREVVTTRENAELKLQEKREPAKTTF